MPLSILVYLVHALKARPSSVFDQSDALTLGSLAILLVVEDLFPLIENVAVVLVVELVMHYFNGL